MKNWNGTTCVTQKHYFRFKPVKGIWHSLYCPHPGPLKLALSPPDGRTFETSAIYFFRTKLSNWCHGIKSVFCLVDIINHFNSNCTVEPVWKTTNSSSKPKNTVSTVKIEHNIYTMCGTAVLEIISANCYTNRALNVPLCKRARP